MNADNPQQDGGSGDRLESFGIYNLSCELFNAFWEDSEILGKDYRGRELVKQQVRSLDSVCANIEEGYGRGEARESRGRYERCHHLLPQDTINTRVSTLNHIIGGLTKTILTIERRREVSNTASASRHPSPVTRHPS